MGVKDTGKVQMRAEIADEWVKVKINLRDQMVSEASSGRPLRWWRGQAAEVPSSICPLNDQTERPHP